ncbi:MAG TPA: T9SS type A sorting domain-containing protein [Chitinophagaceae bacterium]|nr:T9SS type A sorting domain-containing protein [Chitinophagaceae bacterium]
MARISTYFVRLAFIVLLLSAGIAEAQTSCPGFPTMVQTKHTVNIGTYIKGYLAYTPPGYNPAGTQTYPLIIYFHGLAETGSGSATDLCRLLSLYQPDYNDNNPFDIPLPERVERGELGPASNFIILSAQYNQYIYPSGYPSAPDVEAMINHAISAYKVDPERIYLTGMSSGANVAMEYVAASEANASRVAGVVLSSLCTSVGQFPNGPANIANADVPVWAIHCITDDFPGPPGCPDTLVNNWINMINAYSPIVPAKKTTLGTTGNAPCNGGFTHNTWNTVYDPAFEVDGMNVYEWMAQFTSVLPAGLKNYGAYLRSGKVYVEWTTTSESNTDHFILERAGANGQYHQIAKVTAAGASAVDKKYVLIDEQPGKGTNLYRLVLVNKDGKRDYYDVKRVTLPGATGFVNIPNPVRGTMSVYLNVDRSQNVRILVHDINGKTIHRTNKLFTPGLSENMIDVTGLPSGTYFVKVDGETFSVTRKILVNQ